MLMVLKLIEIPIYLKNPQAQERIGATKVAKTAIKFIINHKSDARKVIKKSVAIKRLTCLIKLIHL